ncbi:twin-arginine translocation signal domain-containing protein [Streptomyces sp. NPDC052701]|uniref:twin-arginine translocation signal domain-containing protein n=1 Tax=Streptomyces sp. NPDC052701 TaxID=3155533 RepID=UPI00342E9C88
MSPVTRRRFLKAASGTAVTGSLVTSPPARAHGPSSPPAVATDGSPVRLRFTSVTNGMATATHGGDRIVAEVQNILWSVPRDGTAATPLTPPDLEPSRPVFSPDGREPACPLHRPRRRAGAGASPCTAPWRRHPGGDPGYCPASHHRQPIETVKDFQEFQQRLAAAVSVRAGEFVARVNGIVVSSA